MAVLLVIVGVALLAFGWALHSNWRRVGDWWLDFSRRAPALLGMLIIPLSRTRAGVRHTGLCLGVLGVLFILLPFAS